MPKTVSQSELQHLQDAILRYPLGVGIGKLEEEFHRQISRRTLLRRLQTLLQAGRIQRRGELKGAIYLPASAALMARQQPAPTAEQFETPDGPVTILLSAAAREILGYVARPMAARVSASALSSFR